MKVTLFLKELTEKLPALMAISKSASWEAMTGVLMQATAEKVSLLATDGNNVEAVVKVAGKVDATGSVILSQEMARVFSNLAKGRKQKTATLTLEEDRLHIEAGEGVTLDYSVYPASEYVPFTIPEGAGASVTSSDLERGLKYVVTSAGTQRPNDIVMLEVGPQQLTLTASDSKRVSFYDVPCSGLKPGKLSLPQRAVNIMTKALQDRHATLQFQGDRNDIDGVVPGSFVIHCADYKVRVTGVPYSTPAPQVRQNGAKYRLASQVPDMVNTATAMAQEVAFNLAGRIEALSHSGRYRETFEGEGPDVELLLLAPHLVRALNGATSYGMGEFRGLALAAFYGPNFQTVLVPMEKYK